MKVIVVQLYEVGTYIHAAQLELMEKHRDAGDEVTVLRCDTKVCGCEYNPFRKKLHCLNCKTQFKRGIRALKNKVDVRYVGEMLKDEDKSFVQKKAKELLLPQDELRNYKFEEYDVGEGLVSSLISKYRDADFNPQDHEDIVTELGESGLYIYLAVKRLIEKTGSEVVYVFNGRHVQQRAVRRAAEFQKIDYYSVESGGNHDTYGLFKNATFHNIDYITKEMHKDWDKDPEKASAAGHKFFKNKAKSVEYSKASVSFTKQQNADQLPDGWNEDEHNVVIFCSSEDEYAAIGDEWQLNLYESQLDGLQKIAKDANTLAGNTRFYMRVHPHLAGVKNAFTEALLALDSEHFKVIPAESSVSTYAAMKAADTVAVFCSTAGVEAVYWGTPCVLLGNVYYKHTGCVYNPESHEEAMEMLTKKLEPLPIKGALMYASYISTYGVKYEYATVGKSNNDFSFNGVHLNGGDSYRLIKKIVRKFSKNLSSDHVPSFKES